MKVLVVTPTYNEKDNIESLLSAIQDLKIDGLEVLVVDDSSPDGTGELVRGYAKKSSMPVYLLNRAEKQGLGKAYAAGFAWALERSYDYVISMDADFSHDPKDIPRLLAADADAAVVIGSRYIPGGKIVGWDTKRYLNSKLANMATRLLLGLQPKDATAGFKRYSQDFLKSLEMDKIISSGYAFQVEMILNAKDKRMKVVEIPITFVDRRAGQSKISGELFKSMKIVWQLMWRKH